MPCKPPLTVANNHTAVVFMDLQHEGSNTGPSWDKATNLGQPVDGPFCLPSTTGLDGQKGTIKIVSTENLALYNERILNECSMLKALLKCN